MGEAFFSVPLMALAFICLGAQVWHIAALRTDGEIGNLRLVILLLISLLCLLILITPFVGVSIMPSFLLPVFLVLPIICLKISEYWENKVGEGMEAEELEEEIKQWKRTVRKDPEHVGAYIRLGELYLKLKDNERALHYYKMALSLRPEDPNIIEQIRFLDGEMELMPRFSRSDLNIVKDEFRNLPRILGWVAGGLLVLVLLVFLLSFLPSDAVPVICVLVVIVSGVFVSRWIMRP